MAIKWETALIFWPQNNRTSRPWTKISETVNLNKYFFPLKSDWGAWLVALGGTNREHVFKMEVGIHVHLEFVLKVYISFPISVSTEFFTVISGVHWNPQGAFRITASPTAPLWGHSSAGRSWTFVFAAATLGCFQPHASPPPKPFQLTSFLFIRGDPWSFVVVLILLSRW